MGEDKTSPIYFINGVMMSQKAVRIHGGSMTLGADAEQKNFEIEELISDPVDAVKKQNVV